MSTKHGAWTMRAFSVAWGAWGMNAPAADLQSPGGGRMPWWGKDHRHTLRTRVSPMSGKVPRVVHSVSCPPGTGILGRRERERERRPSSGEGVPPPCFAMAWSGHTLRLKTRPNNAPRRASRINLPPRREDSALIQPRRVARAAAAVATTAPVLVVECVRRRRGARMQPATASRCLLHRRAVAQLLKHGRDLVLGRSLVTSCEHRGAELGRARVVQRRRDLHRGGCAGGRGGVHPTRSISLHRFLLSNLCVVGRARFEIKLDRRRIDARGVRE